MNKTDLAELDLSIPGLHVEAEEQRAGTILKNLRGIDSVRFVARGAWISYNASTITKEEICAALRHAGFHASVFQDSKSGEMGSSSV